MCHNVVHKNQGIPIVMAGKGFKSAKVQKSSGSISTDKSVVSSRYTASNFSKPTECKSRSDELVLSGCGGIVVTLACLSLLR